MRHYCTYFDSAYAPRGLAMMASILRFTPDARFHALCLDETAHRIVRERQPAAVPIRLAELEAFDPGLAAVKPRRTLVEYYFTCTPCLPRYVLAGAPDAGMVTYLDADLFFYRSPELVFEEIGDASVAIVPHRFAPASAHREPYGLYNVAWVTWRDDAEGRRCLEDYRTDCLAWCHDRLEQGRFADQKYLDVWPDRYRGVHALAGKGMNLALWNVDSYRLSGDPNAPMVDDDPLVFMHFHGVKHLGPGTWDMRFREYAVRNNLPFLIEGIYKPYLTVLEGAFNALAGPYGLAIPGDRRFGRDRHRPADAAEPDPASSSPPVSPAAGLAQGAASAGYAVIDRATALAATEAGDEAAWHHAEVSQRQDEAYSHLLAEMRQGRVRVDLAVAATAVRATGLLAPGPLAPALLEVGCGSGYYSEVFKLLLGGQVAYRGLDYSATMIERARRRYPEEPFVRGDATALPFADASVDVVFNGVSLMHILDYPAAIAESRRVARRFCVFHTVPLVEGRPTVHLRKLAYGRPAVEVIINQDELLALFAANGLAVEKVWESIGYDLRGVIGTPTLSRTFLCAVADARSHEGRPPRS